LGTAGLGNLAKLATQYIGGSERSGDLVKAGTMLAVPFLGVRSSEKIASQLYADAESLLPEGARVSAEALSPNLAKLDKILVRGIKEAPGKKELSSIVGQLQDKISNNSINVADLVQSRRDLGSILASYPEIKGVRGVLPELQSSIRNTLKSYSGKNPEFIKKLSQADEIWSAIHSGIRVGDFLKKNISFDKLDPKTALILGVSYNVGIPKVAAAYAGTKALNGVNSLLRSPTLRNIYLDVLKDSFKENTASLIKNVARLDKAVSREEPQSAESSKGRYIIED
jgi:hypothetical protein